MISNKPKLRVLNDLVKVKNASVVFDYETKTYHLVHYDTEIIRIQELENNEYNIVFALKCSNSSTKAIYQLTDNLGIDRKKIKLKPFNHFVKYDHGNQIRLKKSDYLELFE